MSFINAIQPYFLSFCVIQPFFSCMKSWLISWLHLKTKYFFFRDLFKVTFFWRSTPFTALVVFSRIILRPNITLPCRSACWCRQHVSGLEILKKIDCMEMYTSPGVIAYIFFRHDWRKLTNFGFSLVFGDFSWMVNFQMNFFHLKLKFLIAIFSFCTITETFRNCIWKLNWV